MAEPYYTADKGSVSQPTFSGYLSAEVPQLTGASSNFQQRDLNPLCLGSYGLDGYSSVGGIMPGASGMGYLNPLEDPSLLTERGGASARSIGGAMPGASGMGYPTPLEDPCSLTQRENATVHVSAAIPDTIHGRPSSVRSADGPPLLKGESNVLFVDGLPTDCTRREAGHLFRPFIGYKEIKVVHKEARKSGDRATVLCFVEFTDAKCATTAMEALQDYKFDDKKPDSFTLKIQFAHFPFRPPSDHDGQRTGMKCMV